MDIDYNELFGLEPNEGGQAQEVAEPAPLEGGQVQEVAEPAVSDTEPPTEEVPEDDDGEDESAQKVDKEPLTPEQRRANAAERRSAERQEAIDKAVADYKAERDAEDQKIFAQLGIKNPETKELITDRKGILEQIAKAEDAAMQKRLASGKMTKEDLQNIVMQTPAVKELQERAQAAEASAQAMQAQSFQKTMQAEMATIKQRYDQNVNSLADIIAKPNSDRFVSMVQHGASYLEAYRAAFADEIEANARSAGAALARSAGGGKDHLMAAQPKGRGGIEVPPEVKAQYRDLVPDATDEEIRAHYNNYRK